jgi:uncharacterized protein (DUF1778 family)
MSESTVTQPITARLTNREADELRQLAAAQGRSVSSVIAEAVAAKLPELRAA